MTNLTAAAIAFANAIKHNPTNSPLTITAAQVYCAAIQRLPENQREIAARESAIGMAKILKDF